MYEDVTSESLIFPLHLIVCLVNMYVVFMFYFRNKFQVPEYNDSTVIDIKPKDNNISHGNNAVVLHPMENLSYLRTLLQYIT